MIEAGDHPGQPHEARAESRLRADLFVDYPEDDMLTGRVVGKQRRPDRFLIDLIDEPVLLEVVT
jgi:hypothetical protein